MLFSFTQHSEKQRKAEKLVLLVYLNQEETPVQMIQKGLIALWAGVLWANVSIHKELKVVFCLKCFIITPNVGLLE